jgi:hypothetical protein
MLRLLHKIRRRRAMNRVPRMQYEPEQFWNEGLREIERREVLRREVVEQIG